MDIRGSGSGKKFSHLKSLTNNENCVLLKKGVHTNLDNIADSQKQNQDILDLHTSILNDAVTKKSFIQVSILLMLRAYSFELLFRKYIYYKN